MDVGLLVPAVPADLGRLVQRVASIGYSSVWVRDLPGDRTPRPGHTDVGTGWDPFMLLSELGRLLPPDVSLGTAVIRLDLRSPDVVARSVQTLAMLVGQRQVHLGLGWSSLGEVEERRTFLRTIQTIWSCLDGHDPDYRTGAAGAQRFEWSLATARPQVWQGVCTDHPLRLMSGAMNPRPLGKDVRTAGGGRGHTLLAQLAPASGPEVLNLMAGRLQAGSQSLRSLGQAWSGCGVDTVILDLPAGLSPWHEHELVQHLRAAARPGVISRLAPSTQEVTTC